MSEAERRGRRLALYLGIAALVLGLGALVRDLIQGDRVGIGPLVPIAVGIAVILSSRRRQEGP